MCRMLLHYSAHPRKFPLTLLKKFIKSCHWDYFKKYDLVGHHGAGWGYAYISLDPQKLMIRRTLVPIYKCKWQDLTDIKTKFLLIHARKTLFGEKRLENVHPISIAGKYHLVHNGTIKMKSFTPLRDKTFQNLQQNTDLDTRRYLCTVLDKLNDYDNIKDAIEDTLNSIQVSSAANAFLFNLKECHIIKYQKKSYNGRHTTLFIDKTPDGLLISTTPLTSTALELPNKSILSISDLLDQNLRLKFNKLKV